MPLDIDGLVGRMIGIGRDSFSDTWAQVEEFAVPELKKIAIEIAAIADRHDLDLESARLLLKLQVQASAGVIVAMTELVMLSVEQLINGILDALRDFINGVVGVDLL